MTQTIDQRARELLAKHYELLCPPNMTFEDPPRPDWYEYHAAPIAALTEALARIEELEGALTPFIDEHKAQEEERSPSVQDNDKPYQFYVATYGDLRRSALTKGITE